MFDRGYSCFNWEKTQQTCKLRMLQTVCQLPATKPNGLWVCTTWLQTFDEKKSSKYLNSNFISIGTFQVERGGRFQPSSREPRETS